ncbi:MAG: xanthine dehydrogenase family protein molybdopterin-binding subunit [Burkholderiales bacterium]|nr:MAG: xanthine dehydrogenase family protein molybdopterin-binding subunit [Burkholderiales bacterium]
MAATKRFAKTRRAFLIGTGLIGGALAVGATLAWRRVANAETFMLPADAAKGEAAFNAWLKIAPDSTITVAVPRQDMGQGIYTMLAMLVAEELDADWTKVKPEQAPVNPIYGNLTMLVDGAPPAMKSMMGVVSKVLGVQATGGSTSTRDAWVPMRAAAASARAMLLMVAATKWSVPVGELTIAKSIITHAKSGKSAPFGEFAKEAAVLPVPPAITPKPQSEWKLLGTSPKRTDVHDKSIGKAQFGIDVRLDGMLYAAVKHIDLVQGELQAVRWKKGAAPKNVMHEVRGPDWFAVIGKSYWEMQQALQDVELVAGGANAVMLSSPQLSSLYERILNGEDEGLKPLAKPLRRTFESKGNALRTIAATDLKQRIEANYSVPFLAHATMEPMNCTAQIASGKVDVWVGNQAPTIASWLAASAAGVSSDDVKVHTPYLGGGFGRRADMEVVRQALACAKVTGGKPVQVIWSREEDVKHDAYRPAVACKMSAAFDEKGGVGAWYHRIAGPSVTKAYVKRLNPMLAGDDPPDKTNCEGAADAPYRSAIANFHVDHAQVDLPVPMGYWRSVGHSFNAFFVESFVDEIANALKKDSYLFRLELLKDVPRFAKVLDAAASAAKWNTPLTPIAGGKVGRGIAIAESFKSIVAQVVDVEIIGGKQIKLRRVVSAVDCGFALDPENVKAQIASAAIYGLTAALKGKITLKESQVEQSNFNDYGLLSLAEAPEFETVIVNSGEALGGIGEVGLPPVIPALANAIFSASGKRLREMPFVLG